MRDYRSWDWSWEPSLLTLRDDGEAHSDPGDGVRDGIVSRVAGQPGEDRDLGGEGGPGAGREHFSFTSLLSVG